MRNGCWSSAAAQRIDIVVPGADQAARLIADASTGFANEGIAIAANSADVVLSLADKGHCFTELQRLGIAVPKTVALSDTGADEDAPLPCIVKPAADSGGSSFVFYARDLDTVRMYATYLRQNDLSPIAQEYVPHARRRVHHRRSVGSRPGRSFGSIALRREFPAKLSIAARGSDFLISSGYSQGYIAANELVCSSAETLAAAVKSAGPLNVQGRIDGSGKFWLFRDQSQVFRIDIFARSGRGIQRGSRLLHPACSWAAAACGIDGTAGLVPA